jgi:hypothetical protein
MIQPSYSRLLVQTIQRLITLAIKVKNLNKTFWSTTRVLLFGGITLFTLGLLMILRLNPLFNLLTQVIPNTAAVEAAGWLLNLSGKHS